MITPNDHDLSRNCSGKKIKVLEVINSLKIGGAELLLRNFIIEAKKITNSRWIYVRFMPPMMIKI